MSEIKAGALLNYVRMLLSLAAGFFISPYVLSQLGKDEYGLYSIALSIQGWLVMCDFGLSASVTRFLSEYRARGDADGEAHFIGQAAVLFSGIAVLVLLAGGGGYFFLSDLFPHFGEREMAIFRVLYLLTLVNAALLIPLKGLSGISAARQKYTLPGLAGVLTTLLTATGTVLLLHAGYRATALCTLGVGMNLLCMIWNVYYCFRILGARLRAGRPDLPLCRGIFAFSLWVFLDQLTGLLNWGCGNIITGMTRSAGEVAVYSYGLSLTQYCFMASSCISGLFLPRVVALVQSGCGGEELTDLWIRTARVQVLLLGAMASGLFIFGQVFLELWLGGSLGSSTHTTWWVAILLTGSVCPALIQGLGLQILQARNAVRQRVRGVLFISLPALVPVFYLSALFGPVGLAAGSAATGLLIQFGWMNPLYARMGLNVRRFFREVFTGLGPLAVLVLLCRLLTGHFHEQLNSWSTLIPAGALYALLYGLLMLNSYGRTAEWNLLPPWLRRVLIFRSRK